MNQTEKHIPVLQESIERLWQLERAQVTLQRDAYQNLLNEYDTPVKRNTVTMNSIRNTSVQPILPNASDFGLSGESS